MAPSRYPFGVQIEVPRVLVLLAPDGTVLRCLGFDLVVAGEETRHILADPWDADLPRAIWIPASEA